MNVLPYRPLRRALVLSAVAVAAAAGCAKPTSTITGTVSLDGAPATDGSITFEPVDGQGKSAGGKISDGRFALTKDSAVPPGKKVVTVRIVTKTGKKVPAGMPAPPGTMTDEIKVYPPIGGKADTREVEIKEGENEIALDFTTKPGDKQK